MARQVGGFALVSTTTDQADYFSITPTGGLVPVTLGPELAWLVSRTEVPQGALRTGLIDSWKVPPSDPDYNLHKDECLIHEQALAVIAALAYRKAPTDMQRDAIEAFTQGLLSVIPPSGEMPFSVNRITRAVITPYHRTLTQAWTIYALGLYCHLYPKGDSVFQAKSALIKLMPKLTQYQVSSASTSPMKGLLTVGRGEKALDGSFTDVPLHYANIDDNVIAWLAMNSYEVVLGTYVKPKSILGQNLPNFWDTVTYRYQINESGFVLPLDTLTTHVYGGIWSLIQRDPYRANLCIYNLNPYKFFDKVSGFVPCLPERGWPGVEKKIWSAGTFAYANLARKVLGGAVCDLAIASIGDLRDSLGGWSGTLVAFPTPAVKDWPSVCSTAQAILAIHPDIRDIFVTPIEVQVETSKFVDPAFVDPAFVE